MPLYSLRRLPLLKVAALPFGGFVGKDVVGWVEGEGFAAAALAVAGFLNPSDFVVNVMEDAASLVGTLNEVAGFVVGIAAVERATTKSRLKLLFRRPLC